MILTPKWNWYHFGLGLSWRVRDLRVQSYGKMRYFDVFLRIAWFDATFTFTVKD